MVKIKLIYFHEKDTCHIVAVWDCRNNPKLLQDKLGEEEIYTRIDCPSLRKNTIVFKAKRLLCPGLNTIVFADEYYCVQVETL